MSDVVVVDYGAGNTRSVRAALTRLGRTSRVSSERHDLEHAPFVILPGVGSARSAMAHLNQTGAAEALRDRFVNDRPVLGICLGLQLAMDSSEEDGGVAGIGLVEGEVYRLHEDRVPRLGWAMVEPWNEAYYFAHSYAPRTSHGVATSEGITVAVEAGSFVGVQFHPEKSGPAGLEFLERCLSLV
ncbi:MAG TPA: imidazole glycerol phosphate synthase subunit HisH [Acidimicrobiales bacterium]|nr:imidazole glycerol phosphate synthase subunit HisH [Acidimicrobiales bacterium]